MANRTLSRKKETFIKKSSIVQRSIPRVSLKCSEIFGKKILSILSSRCNAYDTADRTQGTFSQQTRLLNVIQKSDFILILC